VEGVSTRTEHTECEPRPHRGLVCLQLHRHRRIIPLVNGDAEVSRLGPQDAVENNRGHAHANQRSTLHHRLEQRTRNTLLMWQRYLGDEQCSRCEVKSAPSTTRQAEGKPKAQYGALGSITAKKKLAHPVRSVPAAARRMREERTNQWWSFQGQAEANNAPTI
jgi:hypothetical protein